MHNKHFKNRLYPLQEFLQLVKYKKERAIDYDPTLSYVVYAKNDPLSLQDQVYIAEPIDIDQNDQEIYCDFALENGYSYYCSDENIQDVVDYAFENNPEVEPGFLLKSLQYYLQKDTFLQ